MYRTLLTVWHLVWMVAGLCVCIALGTGRVWRVRSIRCEHAGSSCAQERMQVFDHVLGASLLFFPEKTLENALSAQVPPVHIGGIHRAFSGEVVVEVFTQPCAYILTTVRGRVAIHSTGIQMPTCDIPSPLEVDATAFDEGQVLQQEQVEVRLHTLLLQTITQLHQAHIPAVTLQILPDGGAILSLTDGKKILFELANSSTQLARAAYILEHGQTLFGQDGRLLDVRFRYPVVRALNLATPK